MGLFTKKPVARQRQRVTGDVPIKMTTYYRSGSEKKAPTAPKRRKKRSKTYLRIVDIVGVLAIFALFGYSLLISAHPKVVASNTGFNSLSTYSSAASDLMSGIGSRNKITFDEQNFKKQLKGQFPEINDANVELPLLSPEAVVRLEITKPVFILNNSGTLLVVGDSGRAIAPAKNFENLADLPVVNDETGYRAVLGRQVMSEKGVDFITKLIELTRARDIAIQSITLPPIAQELRLRTTTDTYFVKFLLSGDSDVQMGQYLAAKERFATGEKPNEYLDVRVPGKVYYK